MKDNITAKSFKKICEQLGLINYFKYTRTIKEDKNDEYGFIKDGLYTSLFGFRIAGNYESEIYGCEYNAIINYYFDNREKYPYCEVLCKTKKDFIEKSNDILKEIKKNKIKEQINKLQKDFI